MSQIELSPADAEFERLKNMPELQQSAPMVIEINKEKQAEREKASSPADSEFNRLSRIDYTKPPPDNSDVFGKPTHGIRSGAEAAQMVNKGFLSPFLLPFDVIDFQRTLLGEDVADRLGTPQRIKPKVNQALANIDFVPQPGDEPVGLAADTLEMFGTTIPFSAGMIKWGQMGADSARMGVIEAMGDGVIARNFLPKEPLGAMRKSMGEVGSTKMGIARSTAMDFSSSLGASSGTKLSEEFEFGPGGTVTTQLLGGFVHPASILNRFGGGGAAYRIRDAIGPDIGGAKNNRRAAREIQKGFKDPDAAAATLDVSSDIPAARQLGTEAALNLEQRALNTDPFLRQQYTDDLNAAIDRSIAEGKAIADAKPAAAEFNRQSKQAQDFAKRQSQHAIQLIEIRAAQAAQEYEIAVAKLGPDARPEDISRAVRKKVEAGYKAGRIVENNAWESIDLDVPFQPTSTAKYVAKELGKMSKRFGDPTIIPADVKRLIATANQPQNLGGLRARSVTDNLTVRDAQAVKTKVGDLYDDAVLAGRSNEKRVYGELLKSLADDMEATGASGIKNARKVSAAFNAKYTQGNVGELLAKRKGGVPRVSPRETMPNMTSRKAAAEGLQQMIDGDPTIANDVKDWVKSSYYTSVLLEAGGNPSKIQTLHKSFMRRLKNQGVSEILPDLEGQLVNTRNTALKDANIRDKLKVARKQGGLRSTKNREKLLANEYMSGNGEIHMNKLFKDGVDPIAEAKGLVKMMEGNPGAKEGLKGAFMDTLYKRAEDAAGNISHQNLSNLISKHRETALALGFTPEDMKRIDKITEIIRASGMKPTGGVTGGPVKDTTGFLLKVVSRFGGMAVGQVMPKLSGGAGVSMQTANIFASQGENLARQAALKDIEGSGFIPALGRLFQSMTRDGAADIVKAAHLDNQLYHALLIAPTDSIAAQRTAAKHIQAWLPALAFQDDQRFQEDN